MQIFVSAVIIASLFFRVSISLAQKDLKVTEIKITGNTYYSDRDLKKIMLTRKYNWLIKNYYKKHLLEDDLNAIANFYINEGYLEARIENYQVKFDTLKESVTIKIQIREGERTKITGISFFGNQVFPDSILFKLIKSSIKEPFKKSILENDRYKLLMHYADHGHIEAKVEPSFKLSPEEHEILIDFNIQEGPQVQIGDFRITGTKKIKESTILRELEFKKGDVYSFGKILKSQRKLYLMGLFNSVFIRPEEKVTEFTTIRDIRIEAIEKKNGELNFGIGYGTLDRVRGSIELLQNNLLGTGRQIGLSGFASFITRRAELSYTEPWLFSTQTKADINGFIEQREEPGFNLHRYGGKFTLGRQIGNYTKLNLAYRYEIVRLSTQASALTIRPNEKGNTRSLTFSIIRDSRDDIVNTTQGAFSSLDIESAGAFLKGTSTFIKFTMRQKYFHPIMRRLIFGTSLTFGWMGNYGLEKGIPIQERFFTGGATSVRGFKEKFVGPKNEFHNPIGGNALLNINLFEFRYTFYKKLSAIVASDLGNVWSTSSSLKKFDLRKGMGVGIRYNSPLGILRFDYGIKLDRHQDESFGEFYFSVGQAF